MLTNGRTEGMVGEKELGGWMGVCICMCVCASFEASAQGTAGVGVASGSEEDRVNHHLSGQRADKCGRQPARDTGSDAFLLLLVVLVGGCLCV